MYNDILNSTKHRDCSLPPGHWLMTQRWDHLLFIHLPIDKEVVQRHIPDGLEIDTYEGSAWITVLPFKINNMHFRKLPPIPFLRSFLELNVRTYVKRNGVKGIYFFSLDADNLPAVLGARIASLPYLYARMEMKKKKDTIYYECKRKGSLKELSVCYRPVSEAYYPERDSLSYWLLERYVLWSYRNNFLFKGSIHHKKWKVRDTVVDIETENIMPEFAKGKVIKKPIFHYAYSKRVLFWPIKKVG
ncbi:YqjF family protein [Gracilibacillus saliphilus]|uniref:YqjF family protein n=1 Tax=Gracilibacillus saliphilus TaxID=543890 RepID=UPI0013D51BEE|nr:DUF2071 domain-containing protein [Gracilibacillus saliphilus]